MTKSTLCPLSDRLAPGVSAMVRDDRGGLLPFIAVVIIPVLAAVGLAIDAARAYMVKERMTFALDAAALAAARVVGEDEMEEDFEKYFYANFPEGYMGAQLVGPNISVSADSKVISVDATATVETTFMRVVGLDDFDVAAASEVTRGTNPVDLVIAMDMSGSMDYSAGGSGGTRIEAAREAATALINSLFGEEEYKEYLHVGLVPWNHEVNVMENGVEFSGTTATAVGAFINPVSGEAQSEVYYPNNSSVPLLFDVDSDWTGCVYARYIDDGSTTNDADVELGTGTFGSADWMGWEPTSVYPSGTEWQYNFFKHKWEEVEVTIDDDLCQSAGITPLQQTKSTILDAIDELTDPEGATNIAQGLVWAWRVLMPEAPFTEAEPDPDPVPARVIVLLTDGEHCGYEQDAYKGVFGSCSGARDDLDDRLRLIAENVKEDGVKIIAIQFANGGTEQQALMQEIASGEEAPYYYYAPTGDDLQSVFEEIGSTLVSLHISK